LDIKVKLSLAGNLQHYGKQSGDVISLDLEDYVKGVVAAEISNAPLEACKAQAVAARTFSGNSGVISDSGASAQVFIAARILNRTDYPNALQGVEETVGEVLTYQGEPIGSNAHYSSANNGTTKSGGLPYLVNRLDEWTTAELARRKASDEKIRFGHGEGLSQYGAMYAARQGIGYREILAFYYPGTTLIRKENAMQKAIDFARAQIGKPYKDRGSGPDSWDCSGLTQVAVRLLGFIWYHGATSQWTRGLGIIDDKCQNLPTWLGYWADSGTIDTLPMDAPAFLFSQDLTRTDKLVMAHTAIYEGNGLVVQAGGWGGHGVWEGAFDKRRFTHWATLKGDNDVGYDVKAMQTTLIARGYDLGVWGADGKQGAKTTEAIRKFQTDHNLPVTGVWTDAEQSALAVVVPTVPPVVPDLGNVTITLKKDVATALKQALNAMV